MSCSLSEFSFQASVSSSLFKHGLIVNFLTSFHFRLLYDKSFQCTICERARQDPGLHYSARSHLNTEVSAKNRPVTALQRVISRSQKLGPPLDVQIFPFTCLQKNIDVKTGGWGVEGDGEKGPFQVICGSIWLTDDTYDGSPTRLDMFILSYSVSYLYIFQNFSNIYCNIIL